MGSSISREFFQILAGSAVAHVGLLVVFIVGGWISTCSKSPPPPQSVIVTKLVKLGNKRDKKLLPRKEAPPPPAAREVALETQADPKPSAAPLEPKATAPSVSDRVAQLSKLSSALDRVRDTAEGEGDPSGVAEGEVTDLSKAIAGNKFITEVYRCMKSNFAVEGIDRSKVAGTTASVFVRVQADGTLFDWKIRKSSGVKAVDRAVLAAVKRCGKVSPPPLPLRQSITKEGILVKFTP